MSDYDLVVIGGGAAGIAAARTGAQRSARTLLIQEGAIGGECTFTGCIPSKALIAAAARGATFEQAMTTVTAAVDVIAATETSEILRREGIDVVHGRATLVSPRDVRVEDRHVRTPRVVIATGSRPASPPIDGLTAASYVTTDDVFSLTRPPGHLAVVGGGAVGCELAQAFGRLGTRVTVLEKLGRLLPGEEPEASEAILAVLRREGVEVVLGAEVTRVDTVGGVTSLHLATATIQYDTLLIAAGRSPNALGLGLEAVGVALDEHGCVSTDDTMATAVSGIWSAGDVTGRMPFTHAADHMGRIAASNALARGAQHLYRGRFRAGSIPWAVFTQPEVGRWV